MDLRGISEQGRNRHDPAGASVERRSARPFRCQSCQRRLCDGARRNRDRLWPVLAEREMSAAGPSLPLVMGNVSVRVRDSRGIARLARLLYTGSGWSDVTFIIPAGSALGPAEVAV